MDDDVFAALLIACVAFVAAVKFLSDVLKGAL